MNRKIEAKNGGENIMGKKVASGKDIAQSAGKESIAGDRTDQGRSVGGSTKGSKPAAAKTRKRAKTDLAVINPEALLAKAIAKGSIETIERLLVMRRELKAEAASEVFFADLARFQAACPVIPKNKIVYEKDKKTVRYRYASIDQIIRYVHKLLGNCGFSYTIKGSQTEKTYKAVAELHHIAGHHEVTEFEVPILADSYMTDPQKVASAASFAKRYAFCNATGIMTGDDDDDGQGAGTVSENGPADSPRDVTPKRKEPETLAEKPSSENVKEILGKMGWMPEKTRDMYLGQAETFVKKNDQKSLRGLVQALNKQIALHEQGGKK